MELSTLAKTVQTQILTLIKRQKPVAEHRAMPVGSVLATPNHGHTFSYGQMSLTVQGTRV